VATQGCSVLVRTHNCDDSLSAPGQACIDRAAWLPFSSHRPPTAIEEREARALPSSVRSTSYEVRNILAALSQATRSARWRSRPLDPGIGGIAGSRFGHARWASRAIGLLAVLIESIEQRKWAGSSKCLAVPVFFEKSSRCYRATAGQQNGRSELEFPNAPNLGTSLGTSSQRLERNSIL
jgi:hypothetical protein